MKKKRKPKPVPIKQHDGHLKREKRLDFWYQHPAFFIGLWPFAKIYQFFFWLNKFLYGKKIFYQYRAPMPVVVVGNLVVGGTGKSACVMALANFLEDQGYRVAIVTRGYGGKGTGTIVVTPESDPKEVGDEPVMIAKKTDCIVVKDTNRAQAARYVAENTPCNLIISDDGMQHHALARDIEIVMYHSPKIKNKACLPQGPFRESPNCYPLVDFILGDEIPPFPHAYRIARKISAIKPLNDHERKSFQPQDFFGQRIHVVCGIAHPDRFFNLLREQGINVIPHPFPDHYFFKQADFDFGDRLPIFITEKDEAKCRALNLKNCYVVEMDVTLPLAFEEALLKKL